MSDFDGIDELSADARALLDGARGADEPTAGDRARVKRALMATLAAGGAAAAAATAALAALGAIDDPSEAAMAAASAIHAAALDAVDCGLGSAVRYAQAETADRVRSHIPFDALPS